MELLTTCNWVDVLLVKVKFRRTEKLKLIHIAKGILILIPISICKRAFIWFRELSDPVSVGVPSSVASMAA